MTAPGPRTLVGRRREDQVEEGAGPEDDPYPTGGGAAGANAPPANPGAPPITGAGAAAITVYIRPSAPKICCGTGAATITGPPTLTPGAGIPATGVGTPANHCPTDGAPAMSAKTRTMTATMVPGTMTAG